MAIRLEIDQNFKCFKIITQKEIQDLWYAAKTSQPIRMVYLEALSVNIKVAGRVGKRAVCVVLGITHEGDKERLGLWLNPQRDALLCVASPNDHLNRGRIEP
jgi:putative transposase